MTEAKILPMVDGGERNHKYPDTFMIPSDLEKSVVNVGDHVMIGFLVPNNPRVETEKIWVKVTGILEGYLVGFLDNDPAFIRAKHLDVVKFEPKNIIKIIYGKKPTI